MGIKVELLIATFVMILVAALIYPTIGDQVTNLTDTGAANDNYVGDDAAPMVSMIPVFWELRQPLLSDKIGLL